MRYQTGPLYYRSMANGKIDRTEVEEEKHQAGRMRVRLVDFCSHHPWNVFGYRRKYWLIRFGFCEMQLACAWSKLPPCQAILFTYYVYVNSPTSQRMLKQNWYSIRRETDEKNAGKIKFDAELRTLRTTQITACAFICPHTHTHNSHIKT